MELNFKKAVNTLKHKFKCVFCDKILSVELPYGSAKSLGQVYKWTLVVNYEYKGRKTFDFAEDDERYVTTYGSARQAALDTYAVYRKSMERQQKFGKLFSRQK